MTQNINQFKQTPEQGEMDLQQSPGNVISCSVDSTQATPLVPGQGVKFVDSAGGVPKVVATAANTEPAFGFVVRNLKDIEAAAYDRVEIAFSYSVMYMLSGAAIARGAKVEAVVATKKVITAAGVNPICGVALDKATGDAQLIRVLILTPANTSDITIADVGGLQGVLDVSLRTARVSASLAEINAGKELIPAVVGKKIRVVGVTQRVTGSAAVATSADLQSGTTAVKVLVSLIAALTNGAVIVNKETNVTPGAGWAADLPVGESLVVANVGTAMTTITSIAYEIQYAYVA